MVRSCAFAWLLPSLVALGCGECVQGEWDADGDGPCDSAFLLQKKSSRTSETSVSQLIRASFRDKLVDGAGRRSNQCSIAIEIPRSSGEQPLRNIRWLHFPKAGTSFAATLWSYACGEKGLPLDLSVSPISSPECKSCYDMALKSRYPPDQYCQPGVLCPEFETQHSPVSPLETRQHSWKVVGMFRRPSQRLISAYHNGLHASGFNPEEWKDLTQECRNDVACYVRYPGIAGCTARMLTGSQCAEGTVERSGQFFDGGQQREKEALEMLQTMAFVGLTERWDESVCLFHRMFGGAVNTAQLVDFHSGGSHQDLYDESVLNGFVDEVDEKIYKAAAARFEELLQKYVANSSACDSLKPPSAKSDDAGQLVQESMEPISCSCEAEGRECGISKAQGINCGNCPTKRLAFLDSSNTSSLVAESELQCEVNSGRCMLKGKPVSDVFAWSFKG